MEKSGTIMSTHASIAFSGKGEKSDVYIRKAAVALWRRSHRFASVFKFNIRKLSPLSLHNPNATDVPMVEILPVSAGARRSFSALLGGVPNDAGLLLR